MGLYYAARKGGVRYLDKHTQTGKGLKFRLWFLRYGLVSVFVPALLPIPPLPTKVFVICAGALGVRAVPFLLVVLAARIPRYAGLAYLGSQLGEHAGAAWLRAHAWQLTAAALVLVAGLFLLIRLSRESPRGAGFPRVDAGGASTASAAQIGVVASFPVFARG